MKKSVRNIIAFILTAVMALSVTAVAWADNAHFIFNDISESQPDLYVAKTVESSIEGYTIPDAEFTFVLMWDKDGNGTLEYAENEIYYVYYEDGTQVWNEAASSYIFRTTQNGQFTLKAGQYARFEWVGQVEYEITELATEGFTQTEPAGGQAAAGTVDKNGTFVIFNNLYIPFDDGETTQLAVRKDISWPSGYVMPDLPDVGFTFQISIDGKQYANAVYTIYGSDNKTVEGTGRTDTEGKFTISGGQVALFDEVEVGVDYKVEEAGMGSGWSAVGDTFIEGSTTSPIVYAYFTNAPYGFVVGKVRTDGITGADGGTFAFMLTDENDNPMSDVTYYVYDSSGNLVISDDNSAVRTTDENGMFTLEAGQKALFIGIEDGTEFNIVEVFENNGTQSDDERDYMVTPADGYTGGLDSSSLMEYEFVNEELTDITIIKSDGELLNPKRLAGAEFTIYVLNDNGNPEDSEDYTEYAHFGINGDSATLTTDADGMLSFTNLPPGTYMIVETKTPAGYVAAGDPIIVTLPYTLNDQEIADGRIDVNSEDFIGLYNKDNGEYYFYKLTYDVTNTASLEMPNTGGNAWIAILLACAGCAAAFICVFIYWRRVCGKGGVRA